jgi:hypothetical protein
MNYGVWGQTWPQTHLQEVVHSILTEEDIRA